MSIDTLIERANRVTRALITTDDPTVVDELLETIAAKDEQISGLIQASLISDELHASTQAEILRLKAALEDAEDTLCLVERPAFRDPQYGDEVEALGRRIGFGALMSSASASWREYLETHGTPVGGEYVAGPCHGTVIATLAKIRAARSLSQDGEEGA